MSYNNARELRKWKQWKQQEEKLLRSLDVEESIIEQLYECDYQIFLSERKIRSRQTATLDTFFLNTPYYDRKEIITVEDLLDNIESESLFLYLSNEDPQTLNILLLRILGYSVHDITEILSIQETVIYNRIHRLKKKLKKFNE